MAKTIHVLDQDTIENRITHLHTLRYMVRKGTRQWQEYSLQLEDLYQLLDFVAYAPTGSQLALTSGIN